MSAFRFVGSSCEIGGRGIKLSYFGQQVEVPDDLAEDIARGGGAIVPEGVFLSLGLSQADLEQLSHAGYRLRAPAALLEKFNAAQDFYRDWVRTGIRPATPPETGAKEQAKGQVK